MKVGVRKSPHLADLLQGIEACGDNITGVDDTGCDVYLAWGWPQCQDVQKKMAAWNPAPLVCLDAHPFALRAGAKSGTRIIQINNWGALADYPEPKPVEFTESPYTWADPDGPVLVIGQVYTAEQAKLGLVDVWHTGGYENWVRQFDGKPGFRFRPHPRVWDRPEAQPTLSKDLAGVSTVLTWNSTCGVHARLMGYPAKAEEAHGWARMDLDDLAGQERTAQELRSGEAWQSVREYVLRAGQ